MLLLIALVALVAIVFEVSHKPSVLLQIYSLLAGGRCLLSQIDVTFPTRFQMRFFVHLKKLWIRETAATVVTLVA
uniref:Putative secreted protein n=1 Tax=Anopheles marajoara TaxID=58244 RepID=A0A2M4CE68_9DIPT